MKKPSITIAICTWNRAELLRGCLEVMKSLRVEPGVQWSILVIDNNSSDETQAVIQDFLPKLPLRGIIERAQGLSHARNCAVAACETDYILWTDDDVRVPSDWLQRYVDTISACEWPVVLGGDIVPDFGHGSPRWLNENWRKVANAYAVREAPGHGVSITPDYLPFGANYAVRMDKQSQHLYDPNLGRKGNSMLSGEEETVIASILSEPGVKGTWLGNAAVIHKIEPFRQSLKYLRSYFAGHGELDCRQRLAKKNFPSGVPLWIYRAIATQYIHYLNKRYLARDKEWIDAYTKFAFTIGELRARRDTR